MKKDALSIINAAIKAADPYENTKRLLEEKLPAGKINVLAVGKAAVPMAEASRDVLGDRIGKALLVTKYFHSEGFSDERFEIIEAGHPVSDDNSILAAEKGLGLALGLEEGDVLLVLLSVAHTKDFLLILSLVLLMLSRASDINVEYIGISVLNLLNHRDSLNLR